MFERIHKRLNALMKNKILKFLSFELKITNSKISLELININEILCMNLF